MDKLLYIAMSGAKQNFHALGLSANNLANAKTTGFKADLAQARSMQAFGEGLPTRVFAMTERASQNFDNGAMIETGRELDIAIIGDGYLAVQAPDGSEAYTRSGHLKFNVNGTLETSNGEIVLGENGPVTLPLPIANLHITKDGLVMIQPEGAPSAIQEEVARLRLVKPDNHDVYKGNDGLFRRKDGQEAEYDVGVRIQSGMLESSNVNPVSEMTQLITLQRQFEMHMKLMKTAEEMDQSAASLLRSF